CSGCVSPRCRTASRPARHQPRPPIPPTTPYRHPPARGWPSSNRTCAPRCWPSWMSVSTPLKACLQRSVPGKPHPMSKNPLRFVVFAAGLLAIGWIAAGYVTSNVLGLVVTAVIAACYLAGALELHRYRQATTSLEQAVADVGPAQSDLGAWLGRLHPGLRNAVRLRVE